MKQQIFQKFTEFANKSHLPFGDQIKKYLETPEETDEEGQPMINAIFPGNERYSFNCRLKDEDIQPLSITYMTYVQHIRIIDLSYNKITDKGISILSKLLDFAPNIQKLNLKGNQICDKGCESLTQALIKSKANLTYFNLNTNIFGNLGIMSINELLFKTPSLLYLNLGCNRYDWDGIIAITSALKTTNNTLLVLNLDDPAYKIQDQHFFNHFGKMFLSNTSLKKLSLRFHQIRWEAISIIFENLTQKSTMLNKNQLMKRSAINVLDLSGNQICFQGITYISNYLKTNDIMKSLILSSNKISNYGIKVLANGLIDNKTLTHLDITSNGITGEGFVEFGKKLIDNIGIRSLKLFWKNEFDDESIKVFDDYLKSKGKEFYPDFVIYEDELSILNIAYLETHIPEEEEYLITE